MPACWISMKRCTRGVGETVDGGTDEDVGVGPDPGRAIQDEDLHDYPPN